MIASHFLQFPSTNSNILSEIRLQQDPSASFPIHYAVTFILLGVIWCDLLTEPLNKPFVKRWDGNISHLGKKEVNVSLCGRTWENAMDGIPRRTNKVSA